MNIAKVHNMNTPKADEINSALDDSMNTAKIPDMQRTEAVVQTAVSEEPVSGMTSQQQLPRLSILDETASDLTPDDDDEADAVIRQVPHDLQHVEHFGFQTAQQKRNPHQQLMFQDPQTYHQLGFESDQNSTNIKDEAWSDLNLVSDPSYHHMHDTLALENNSLRPSVSRYTVKEESEPNIRIGFMDAAMDLASGQKMMSVNLISSDDGMRLTSADKLMSVAPLSTDAGRQIRSEKKAPDPMFEDGGMQSERLLMGVDLISTDSGMHLVHEEEEVMSCAPSPLNYSINQSKESKRESDRFNPLNLIEQDAYQMDTLTENDFVAAHDSADSEDTRTLFTFITASNQKTKKGSCEVQAWGRQKANNILLPRCVEQEYDSDIKQRTNDTSDTDEDKKTMQKSLVVKNKQRRFSPAGHKDLDINIMPPACEGRVMKRRYQQLYDYLLDITVMNPNPNKFEESKNKLVSRSEVDADVAFIIGIVEVWNLTCTNKLEKAGEIIQNLFQLLKNRQTFNYNVFLLMAIKIHTYIALKQANLSVLENELHAAENIISMDSYNCTGCNAGWIYMHLARKLNHMMAANQLKRSNNFRQAAIRCLQRSMDEFRRDTSSEGEGAFIFTALRRASLLAACDENLYLLKLQPTGPELKEAEALIEMVRNSHYISIQTIKPEFEKAQADVSFRQGRYKAAYYAAKSAYETLKELEWEGEMKPCKIRYEVYRKYAGICGEEVLAFFVGDQRSDEEYGDAEDEEESF